MQKSFCDLCGAPALESLSLELRRPVGEPRRGYEMEPDGSGCEAVRQCKITVRVAFGFEQHRTGFGGPPDLCGECRTKLLDELTTASRERQLALTHA